MEDDLNGRLPQWKMAPSEDELNGRTPLWKGILMEVDLNGSLLEDDNDFNQVVFKPRWCTCFVYIDIFVEK